MCDFTISLFAVPLQHDLEYKHKKKGFKYE